MIGHDTNVVLRRLMEDALSGDDAPHQAARIETSVANAGEAFFIDQVGIVETAWVPTRRARVAKDALVKIVAKLLNMGNTVFQQRDVVLSTLASDARNLGGISDHPIGAINRHNGDRLTRTFDTAAARSPQFSELQR